MALMPQDYNVPFLLRLYQQISERTKEEKVCSILRGDMLENDFVFSSSKCTLLRSSLLSDFSRPKDVSVQFNYDEGLVHSWVAFIKENWLAVR